MNIPEEAINAAALQLFLQHSNTNGPDLVNIWRDSLSDDLREPFIRDARAAIEAAAPFLMPRT